jgi:hypothetical protein
MLKNKQTTLFCFSPPVMIATFLIEVILMIAAIATRKLNKVGKLIAASLFSLAFFQLCEYFVCGGLGVDAVLWSRLGFIAITTLPPLGLHIIHEIAGKKSRWMVQTSYVATAGFIFLFGFSENAFTNHQCVSNYVIFHLDALVSYVYSAYYYGILLLGIYVAMNFARKTKKKGHKEALYGMIVGYLTFLLPTAIANTIKPETMAGIPSIMCGFAILFALILFSYVLPRTSKRR